MQSEVIIKNIVNPCSICKNKDTEACKQCEISKENIIPNNFLADTSKITPFFVDSYYELLNEYTQLFNKIGLDTRIESFDLGE